MTSFTFTEIEPGVAYEYAVGTGTQVRIGRVRKEEAASWPYHPTGRWISDDGRIQKSGFPTRMAAAEWLASWLSTGRDR
jgi:hypothetical protein